MAQAERTLKLTVELPEPIVRLLSRLAELTHQTPEALAAQSITGNLPPSIDSMPFDIQAELLNMQTLPTHSLWTIAKSQIEPTQQVRHFQLLERMETEIISLAEEEELAHLRQAADQLMLRKAYAWALLRWKGEAIPTLNELPLES